MKYILAILLAVPLVSLAWEPSPNKSIEIMIGNPPGAGNEMAIRELMTIVSQSHPIVKWHVINFPGADNVLAMNKLYNAAPDGYQFNTTSYMSTFVTNDVWQKNVKQWQWDEFSHILTFGKTPLAIIAGAKSNINTPEEFVQMLRSTTKPVNITTAGGSHMAVFEYVMTKSRGNTDLVKSIKFQGPLQAATSVAQYDGNIGTEFGIAPITVAKPLIEAGKVKAIAFTGTRKMSQFPNVPLLNTVIPGINIYTGWSIVLPPNTPPEIIDWYVKTLAAAIRTTQYQQWCSDNIVFVEENELTPAGVVKTAHQLRNTFLPLLEKIDIGKE
jgi:tripartite-type tricarboxylate transporter receptor subunit TctC